MEQSISENLWWLIPKQLAGVRKPNSEELLTLQAMGIGAIVSVMDDPTNLDLYEAAGLSFLWLPIQGGSFPTPEQLQRLEDFVEEQTQLDQGVAVHCTNGRRRTGTLLAAFLIQRGQSFDQAMQALQAANPTIELREAQLDYLKALADKNDLGLPLE